MAREVAEACGEKGSDEFDGEGCAHDPAAKAADVHVVIFNALTGRVYIADQAGSCARDFVGCDRCADATAAQSEPAFDITGGDGACHGDDEVRVVVVGVELVSAEIDDFKSMRLEPWQQCLFEIEPAMIGCDANAHCFGPLVWRMD